MTDYKSFFEEIKNKVLSLIEEASSIEEITEIKNKYLSHMFIFSGRYKYQVGRNHESQVHSIMLATQ